MGEPLQQTDAFAAADNYRRAAGLLERAREGLLQAALRTRTEINLRALSRRAGLNEQTLNQWMMREKEVSGNGGIPPGG